MTALPGGRNSTMSRLDLPFAGAAGTPERDRAHEKKCNTRDGYALTSLHKPQDYQYFSYSTASSTDEYILTPYARLG